MRPSDLQLLNKELVSKPDLPVKVLQFGEGNFLRAFVDWMIQRMNDKQQFNGSVVVVQPIEQGKIDLINEQDGLYTVILKGIKNGELYRVAEIIKCIQKGIDPYLNYHSYLAEAENPNLRFIISNTTEAGIAFDPDDHIEDLPPSSFPAKLTAFLYRRYQVFSADEAKGFVILPCELIDRNGDQLKSAVERYARLWKLGTPFLRWLNQANTFCNTLVDRIVPGYPKDEIENILEELGYEDLLVTEGEYFHLWVIESPEWVRTSFPAWQAGLNVVFTKDLAPFRMRKVRVLNGAHTCMVPIGYLAGVETVKEMVEHKLLGKFIQEAIYEEIIPTLDLPVAELKIFASDVLDRFRNPFIRHYLISIALNSSSKFTTRVLPSILDYYGKNGKLPKRLVFSLASLIRFYSGQMEGKVIPLQDEKARIQFFKARWTAYDQRSLSLQDLTESVFGRKDYWGIDLRKINGLSRLVTDYLQTILLEGMENAVKRLFGS